ncbi:MAG: hypothetical protein CMQ70_01240 [Gammaproteobacteria bacterium]|nr:hypothetical protein [Gammaproteobacteria bacterium]|tara:strand:- start:5591 stop:6742 length:1152 start_codon:yes stop_codon:yes gene_type:complete
MHLNVYTKIIHQIFFNELDQAVTSLKNLNSRDKKAFLRFVSFSRIEHFFIKKIESKNIKLIFGSEEASWLKNNSIKRAIRTAESKSFAKKISKELKKINVNHIFLKGINMHEHFYQDNLIRPLSDVDILIDKQNLCELIEICKKYNFDTTLWDSIDINDLEIYKNPTLKHKNELAHVDIHTELKSSIFVDSQSYKEFGQNLLKNAEINNSNLCSREDTFLHCLFHGTIQSNYNVGPIFILDIISMLKSDDINWDLINKKVGEYKLKKEFNEVMFYISSSMHVSNVIFKINPNKNLDFKDLRNIFMTIPKNTSLFALRGIKDLKVAFEKVFHKKYVFQHNQQKLYFKYFLVNLFRLFNNHVLLALSNNFGNSISKKRYKLLREK